MTDGWTRITVNISDDLAALIKKKAKKNRRSTSAHIAWLIERDLGAMTNEDAAPYLTKDGDPKAKADPPERGSGAGPASALSA